MHKTFKDIKDLDTKIQRLIIQELNKLKQNNNINEFKEKRYIKGQVEAFLKDIDIEQNIDNLLEDTFTVYNGVADYSQPYDLINFKDQQREMLNDTSRIFDSLPYSAAKDFVEMNKDINKMIASGEVTINQAVKTVSDNYNGVKIRYKNGSKHKFSDYLFMVYQTNQTAACKEQSFRNAEDIGTELFIFSGVMDKNIRDDCLFLLDKIVAFGKSGSTTDLYDNVIKYYDIEKHGYGEPGGALGIRCTHILFPFVEGVSTLNNYNRDIIGEVNQLDNSKETKVEAPVEEKEFDAN